MIQVYIHKYQNKIDYMDIKGHANYSKHGEDLVCAGVSCVIFGLLNAIEKYNCIIDVDNDEITIKVNDLKNEKIQSMLELVSIQLETIKGSYGDYLEIRQEENS
ncbi:MAG: ribosomal-processing cysteine protease Prp [Anaerorhabdus sp.]